MRMRTEAFNSCVDCCAVANLAALFLAADAKTFTDTENVKLTEKKIKPWPERELQKLFHCL